MEGSLQGHRVFVCLTLHYNSKLFSKMFIVPLTVNENSCCFTASPPVGIIRFSNLCQPGKCNLVSHCGFNLLFSD